MFAQINNAYSTSMSRGIPIPDSAFDRPDVFNQVHTTDLLKTLTRETFTDDIRPQQVQSNCNDIQRHLQECERCRAYSLKRGSFGLNEHAMTTLVSIVTMMMFLILLDIFVRIGSLLVSRRL